MIKNLVTISLMIFIIAVILILSAAIYIDQGTVNIVPAVRQNNNINTTAAITAIEVAKHNTASDCWTIVDNKVYNVTDLIPIHSGGPDQIIAYCGKDATTAFNTKNGRGSHSQRAKNILNSYYVGELSR